MAVVAITLTEDEKDDLIRVAAEKGHSHGGQGSPAIYLAWLARRSIREWKEVAR